MNLSAKHLIKILEQHGFVFSRARGSHQIFYNSSSGKTIVVPVHGNKDLPKGTFFAILRQAGIDKKSINEL
jgi:predicted RNA binding protein YcfA (HicA-like mRNA interferase family)